MEKLMFKKRIIVISAVFLLAVFVWIGLTKEKDKTVVKVKPKAKTSQVQSKSSPANNSKMAQQLYDEAIKLKNDRQLIKAKEILQNISENYSNFDKIDNVQNDLEQVNMSLILSNVPVPNKSVMYTIESGDTLDKLAKKYGTTIDLIKINNNLKSDVIRLGQKLRIWTGKFNIFVDKSRNILILKEGDEVVKIYNVSTGENNSTPVGDFKVTTKLTDPVWFNKGVVVPPESPANVLGSRWMGFDIPGYGIHGTVEPDKIGQQVTAGCVRMRNNEVEELYNLIPVGTLVSIVD
jgi:lipoprotein-anchoring transpeptidase ErfK/SrfK